VKVIFPNIPLVNMAMVNSLVLSRHMLLADWFLVALSLIDYSAPLGEMIIVMTVSVCVFIHEQISGTTCPIFTKFFVPVGCILVMWRCFDTICTSGFMDYVIFAHK